MATVSKTKKPNQPTLLQGQLDDIHTAFNKGNRKSIRISSIGDKKADSNNNADSDNKTIKKSRRQSDSGHSNDEDNSNNPSAPKRSHSESSNEENEHHNPYKSPENSGEIEGVNNGNKSPSESSVDEKGDLSPENENQQCSEDSNKVENNQAQSSTKSTLPENAYLYQNFENAFHLADQGDIAVVASHMSNLLKNSKRKKDFFVCYTGIIRKELLDVRVRKK
jgi:hypothetical protein